MSLPSRISYLIATAHLPLIVLGDKDSAATQFILENEIGLASSYEPEDFKQVVAKLVQPDQQAYFRKMAARLAPNFSASRFETGLWTSLQTMKPIEFMSQRRTVIVTPNEVNDRHGTGVMVKRLFKSQTDNLISIRSKDDYSGDHQLGQIQIQMEHSGKFRSDIYRTILQTLSNKTIDHIICVPYYEDDLKTAIALKDIYDASLAIYIMDDQNAVASITGPKAQEHFRKKALEISSSFSDQSLLNWLYNSLDLKQPADDRFDRHFMRGPVDLVQYLEPPVPSDIYHDFIPVYQALGKLKIKGYEADFIVDVGCSFGIWSYTASKHYPVAKFYLIDPLMSYYSKDLRDAYQSKLKHLTLGEIALSNQNGKTRFNLAPDLYGSSLMNPADFRTYEGIEVDVKTLDTYASEQNITGRGILKLDVQCAEHLIVDGAKNFLSQVDAIVIELSLIRYDENSLVYAEMIQLMDQLGYRYFDETGEWRSPQNGVLLQKELLFTRKSLLNDETSRVIQHDNSGKSN